MLRKATQGGLAASITGAVAPSTSLITYTTLDPHNLYPGARVTITGLSSSTADSANVNNALITKIDSPTSFSVGVTLTTIPTITLAGGTGVYGTMYAPNGSLNLYALKYGQPVATARPTYYNYVYPTITTQAIGSGILVSWSAVGIANPAIATTGVVVSRISSAGTTTTLTSTSVGSGSYFDTSGVYTTGTANTFTYRVSAANSVAANNVDSLIASLYITAPTVTAAPTFGTPLSITVSWNLPTTNASLTNFELQRATNSAFSSGLTTLSTGISPSATSYVDTTVVAGTAYYYRLRAKAAYTYSSTPYDIYSSYGATSASVKGYYISDPTSLTVSAVASTANQISVSWTASSGAEPALTYYILSESTSTDNATWSSWSSVQQNLTTSYTKTAATSGVYYRYQVVAYNGVLNSNAVTSSGVLAYYLADPLGAPTVTNQSTSTSALVVSGNYASNPAISGYTIRRSSDGGSTWTNIGATNYSLVLPYTDTSVATTTSYVYQVKAKNSQLTTANWSASSASLLTYGQPTAPTGLTATSPVYNTVNLSWTAATSSTATPVTGYKVERATNSGFSTGLTSWTGITGTAYSDTSASELTTYYYRVSALNSVGYSVVSGTATATTPAQAINTTTTINAISAVTFGTAATVSGSISPNPGGGTVTITEGTTTLATASVVATTGAWSATLPTSTLGTHNLTASFALFGIYQPSTATASYTVNQAPVYLSGSATATNTSLVVTNSTYPNSMTITGYMLLGANQPLTYGNKVYLKSSGGTILAEATQNPQNGFFTLSYAGNAGTYNSNTVYTISNGNYAASATSTVNFTIAKATPTLTTSASSAINSGSSTSITGTLNSLESGVSVTFYYGAGSVIGTATTGVGGQASVSWTPGAGTYSVYSVAASSTNYNGATSASVSQYVRTQYSGTYDPGYSGNTWVWYGSTSTASQVGSTFTMPNPANAVNLTVSSIDIVLAGYSGNQARVIGCLWDSATSPDNLISSGSTQYFSSVGGGSAGYHNLGLTDVAVTGGKVYACGFWRYHTSTSYYTQWDIDTNTGNHRYYDNSASAPADLNHDTSVSGESIRLKVNYYYWA